MDGLPGRHHSGHPDPGGDVTGIYDLRGTHGSGKSTVMKHFQAIGSARVLYQPCETGCNGCPKDPEKHSYGVLVLIPGLDRAVLCPGGRRGTSDCIKTRNELYARILRAKSEGRHVLVEGFMHSPGVNPWSGWAKEQAPWRFGFLDTPAEECVRRVMQRRAERGIVEERLLDRTVKNITGRHRAVEKAIAAHRELGSDIELLPHEAPPAVLARRIASWFHDQEKVR